eukprot:7232286-Alexandrium_andersonii.AAC.1
MLSLQPTRARAKRVSRARGPSVRAKRAGLRARAACAGYACKLRVPTNCAVVVSMLRGWVATQAER